MVIDDEPTADGCSIGSMSSKVKFDLPAPSDLPKILKMVQEALPFKNNI